MLHSRYANSVHAEINSVRSPAGPDAAARAAVLRYIRDIPQTTRTHLAAHLGLSASTVSRIVARLQGEQLVLEGPSIERAALGRRPTTLAFNGSAFHLVGVEISGRRLTAAVTDLDGTMWHASNRMLPQRGGAAAVEVAVSTITALMETAVSDGLRVRGIGIGAPGVTDFARGSVTWAPALGWRDLPLRDLVEDRLGLPTFVENDINLAALGEHWLGAGRGAESMAYVHVSEGIGAGLVIGGELWRGHHHSAGEVGYVLPDRASLNGSFTDVGAMESVATTAGITQWLAAPVRRHRRTELRDGNPATPARVFAAAARGERLADELAEELLDHIAMMLTSLLAVLDPHIVVLGGDLASEAGQWAVEGLADRIGRVLPAMGELRLSSLGDAAGVLGASALALLEVEELHLRPRLVSYA